jgi:hypothetical protein
MGDWTVERVAFQPIPLPPSQGKGEKLLSTIDPELIDDGFDQPPPLTLPRRSGEGFLYVKKGLIRKERPTQTFFADLTSMPEFRSKCLKKA